ncbi:MAG: putative sulfate/molybdate transporter [Actinobacteria bacterium]|nr:putative sulfate/molybdate transporter [Actinomycetota bacterium]
MARLTSGDLSGAVADLGVLVPLAAALVLVNGVQPGPLLIGAGALALGAGLFFRIPFPVQPLKALTALAVAQGVAPEIIHAAGLEIGILFVVLGATGVADRLAILFTKDVIRSLQFAVGILLVVSAVRLSVEPPAVFGATFGDEWVVLLTVAVVVVVAVASRFEWNPAGALILLGGVVATSAIAAPAVGPPAFNLPALSLPPLSVFGSAFLLLVIPQVPLTYGNAIVGVSDLAAEQFGTRAIRVTPRAVALSCGLGNVASAVIGGMPMCHGSSGLSAHVRLGARSHAMNVLLGTTLIVVGLVYSEHVIALFGVLPVWALAGFLAYAGMRHAVLVADLRGKRLAIAIVAGTAGVATGNLIFTTALAIASEFGARLWRRRDAVPSRV